MSSWRDSASPPAQDGRREAAIARPRSRVGRFAWSAIAIGLLVILVSCSASETAEPEAESDATVTPTTEQPQRSERGAGVDRPTVEGPITGGRYDLPFNAMPEGLAADYGYVEEEFFISGEARAYAESGDWDTDGRWEVGDGVTAPFVTRIVVRRPSDPDAFDGTAIVEWHNVSSGLDANPDFGLARDEALAHGSAWIGVSAQRVGVDGEGPFFTFPGFGALPLKDWDPDRYADLVHPGDEYSYDIFSQAAQALLRPDGPDPMGGLAVEHVLAIGDSQSATRLLTYVNAIHPHADLFDGFLLHSRFGSGAVLADGPEASRAPFAWVRTDSDDPVVQFVTETDLFQLSFASARQPDTDHIRTWEVAGAAHLDASAMASALESTLQRDPSAELDVSAMCGYPVNDGPTAPVLRKALADLRSWVVDGVAPASADPIETSDDAIARDEDGIALGGIRTPAVDAPVSVLSGEGSTDVGYMCSLFGSTVPFDDATIRVRYPSPEEYVDAVASASATSVEAGHLLRVDADRLVDEAREAPYPPS